VRATVSICSLSPHSPCSMFWWITRGDISGKNAGMEQDTSC
jgi:hypothetical protein